MFKLVARYARRETVRELEISKVEQLIKEHGAQFNVPPTIGGTMTKVADPYLSRPLQAASRVPLIIDGAPHEVVRTDSEETGGPRNSPVESLMIDLNETSVVSPSSDYVSTLRDPNESQDHYPKTPKPLMFQESVVNKESASPSQPKHSCPGTHACESSAAT